MPGWIKLKLESRLWGEISTASDMYVVTLFIKLICRVSTSCEMPGWIKLKLESRLWGEISKTSHRQMTPNLWQKVRRNPRVS